MTRITVEADGQKHDVVIGPLDDVPSGIFITDELIWALHGDRFPHVKPVFVPPEEAAKSWRTLERLIEELAARNITRDTPIVAFGGGSIGDVGGLAAALFKRGCPLIHIPTTLVAQVDSAIGGKVAIDAAGLKNLVGTFYLPDLVLCDPALLLTLNRRQLRAGYAELVKYGLIDDPAMFAWCEANVGDLLNGDLDLLGEGIGKAVAAKARFIRDDFHDRTGTRALLNFGHTFGHAIETLSGLGPVLHGEGVAVGMALAFALSAELDLCPTADAERATGHLRAAGLPTTLSEVGLANRGTDLMPIMARDKKVDAGGLTLILTRGIGRAFVSRDVGSAQLAGFLNGAG